MFWPCWLVRAEHGVYWLRQLSLYQKRYNLDREAVFTWLLGELKNIASMEPKYSKGMSLTNLLKT